jgi:putative ABC transport system substrate-binding protein
MPTRDFHDAPQSQLIVASVRAPSWEQDGASKGVVLEVRFTDRSPEKLSELAAELLRLNVDVIVASGTPAALVARNLTRTMPIVIVGVNDPVGTGLVKELSRPGGNVTGLTNQTPDLQ